MSTRTPTTTPSTDDASLSRAQVRFIGTIGRFYVVTAALLVPWVAYLVVALPSRQIAAHYDVAWVGFDLALMLFLLVTGVLVVRRSPWVVLTASFTAALLTTDAWFDVVTSAHASERVEALVLAVVVEIPLALLSLVIAARVLRRVVGAAQQVPARTR